MFLRKIIRSFLILFLAATSMLVILNLLISLYPEKIVSYFLPENYSVSVDEIPSVFLPFYFSVSGLEVKSDKFSLSARSFDMKADYEALMNSGSFLSINIFDGNFNYRSSKSTNYDKVNFNPNIFKQIRIFDSIVNYESELLSFSLNTKNLSFDGSSGFINGKLGESSITSDKGEQTFTGSMKARLVDKRRLVVDHLNVNGKNFYVNVENGRFSKNENYAQFEGAFDNTILSIFSDIQRGNVSLKGKYDSGKLSARAELRDIQVDNVTVSGILDIYGDVFKKLLFKSSELKINDTALSCNGSFMTETFDINADYSFNGQPVIYENKNYKIKLGDGHAEISNHFRKFDGSFNVFSHENYRISYSATMQDNITIIENVSLNSGGTELSGSGDFERGRLNLDFSGDVVNNKDLMVHLNFRHHLKVEMSMKAESDSFNLSGTYRNVIPSKIYNIPTEAVAGKINIDGMNLDFTANGKLKKGEVNVAGNISENFQKYNIKASSVPFNRILAYFNVKSGFDNAATGSAEIKVKNENPEVTGKFYFLEPQTLPEHNIIFSYNSGVLNVDSLKVENRKFKNPAFLDFNKNYISGKIITKRFKYADYPELKNAKLYLHGSLKEPVVNIDFDIRPVDFLHDISVSAAGHYDNISVTANNDQLEFKGNIFPVEKKMKGRFDFKAFNIKGVKPSGTLFLKSSDLRKFLIESDQITVDYDKYKTQLSNISMTYHDGQVQDISALISNDYITGVKIINANADMDAVRGSVNFDNSSLSGFYLKDADLSGELNFSYLYSGYPGLFGDLELKGNLYSDFVKLRLKNVKAQIHFSNLSISGDIASKDLDTSLEGNFEIPEYYRPLEGSAHLKTENLYLEKYGFKGTVNIEGNYVGKEKLVNADVIVKKAYFSHENQNLDSVAQGEKNEFPLKLNINIKTAEPVQLQNEYITGGLNLNLNVEKDDLINVTGRITAVNSHIRLGTGSFMITSGYVRFMENSPPFLFLDASGEKNFRNLRLNVKGFLPQYEVEVRSMDPSVASDYVNTGSKIGKEQLLSKMLGGLVLKDVMEITQKVIGISEIDVSFNQRSFRGGQGEYVSIDKRFSDRLKLSYMIGVSGEESFNSVVGEYTLLDWLNLFVYTTPNGGTGAGFTLLNGF